MGQNDFWLWTVLLVVVLSTSNGSETQDETTPEEYLLQVNQTFSHYGNLEMEARWAYITDISEQNEVSMVSTYFSYFPMSGSLYRLNYRHYGNTGCGVFKWGIFA